MALVIIDSTEPPFSLLLLVRVTIGGVLSRVVGFMPKSPARVLQRSWTKPCKPVIGKHRA
jgi:hypothetical protein